MVKGLPSAAERCYADLWSRICTTGSGHHSSAIRDPPIIKQFYSSECNGLLLFQCGVFTQLSLITLHNSGYWSRAPWCHSWDWVLGSDQTVERRRFQEVVVSCLLLWTMTASRVLRPFANPRHFSGFATLHTLWIAAQPCRTVKRRVGM